jgi:hypothetical protein
MKITTNRYVYVVLLTDPDGDEPVEVWDTFKEAETAAESLVGDHWFAKVPYFGSLASVKP